MKYALGNMLNGAGGLNADGLSLDLQFAADKTLTARKGPTPTFLRASGATQVNAAGLIEWAPENQYLHSQNFADSFWNKTRSSVQVNSAIAPDGTLTATKLIEDTTPTNGHTIGSAITPTAVPHRLSIFAKKGERNWIVLRLGGSNDFFNLDTGVATTNTNSPVITNVGNGWYRCSVVSGAGTQGSFLMSTDGTSTVYTGDGTSGIFIWGAQLERSSTARAYIPTTTAAVYGPRFDHDPVSLACKGLLIEEQRMNSWSDSENLGGAPWSLTSTTTPNSNNTVSPDGLTTSERFTVGSTTQEYGFSRNTFSFVSGTAYSISFFFKADQITRINILTNNLALLPINAIFDLTGSGSIVGTPTGTASIQRFFNGWYRCSVSATALLSGITSVRVAAVSGTSISYPGNSIDSFWAWGAQLEAGAFPTSYIPTTTGPVTRSADVCSITGSDFSGFYNPLEGTTFVSVIRNTNTGAPRAVAISDGTVSNRMEIARGSSSEQISYSVGGSFLYSFDIGGVAVGVGSRIAQAMKLNDFAASVNGSNVATNNSGAMMTANRMIIGAHASTPTNYLNGTISRITYYRKRLSNAKLQTLTT